MTDGAGEGATTPALDAVAAAGIPHRVVRTRRAGSVEEAAELRGVPGDRVIDWPKLRAHLGVRRLSLPDPDEARTATGYARGAITPFGATHAWPVVVDASVAATGPVSLGGGAHGVSIMIDAPDLVAALGAVIADVTA